MEEEEEEEDEVVVAGDVYLPKAASPLQGEDLPKAASKPRHVLSLMGEPEGDNPLRSEYLSKMACGNNLSLSAVNFLKHLLMVTSLT